jgi:hypothetical protein
MSNTIEQHAQSSKKGDGNVYAIIGKNGLRQSINHVCQIEF